MGETSDASDNTQNKVTISNSVTPMSINSNSVKGITWRNINFVNTATGTAPAVSLRGTKNAFYNCQFISAGGGVITSTLGITLIANSYIEGTDKLLSGYLGLYVFESEIVATASSSTIVYSRGYSVPVQISQTVLDSCSIVQKPGTTNTYVWLAAANGEGAQTVFKYTSMASFIAPGGTKAVGVNGFFGEYATTGPGSYQNDKARVDILMTTSMLSNFTLNYVFANSFPGYSTTATDWIDAEVLRAIVAANSEVVPVPVSSSVLSSSASSTPVLSTASSTSSESMSVDTSSSITSSTSSATSPASTCSTQIYPSSVPATALTVGPLGSCANYTSLQAAISDLPIDSTSQYIYILAGVYTEQIPAFNRAGPTTFRGESTSPLDQNSNLVTLQYSGSVLSNAGGSEEKSVFRSTQYNSKKYAFYNINFFNTATISPNTIAIAMDIKAQQVGFYSCGFSSGGGTFLANYGTFFLDGCRIEGSSDFFWGYGAAYISNSLIVSNAPGYTIAAQSYVTTYASQFVFDHCAFVPKSTASMSKSTYLGRDYSASAHVSVINSFLDGHINPAGWLIKAVISSVAFSEYNNTGPGYVQTSRIAQVQLLNDGANRTIESVLGDVSWIDQSAIAPLKAFPPSVFEADTPTGTSSSILATPTPTSSGLPAAGTYVVSLQPSADEYGSVSAAILALPNDGLAKVILIKPGIYTEQVNIQRTGKVTLRGTTSFANDYSQNEVTLQFNYGVSTSAGQNELTPVLYSKKNDGSGLSLYNINFVNTFPQQNNYAALAADFYGANMAAYGCKFIGFQDTLLANKGTQLFSNCYIEGSVDFIWGFSTAYFYRCYLAANTPGTSIAAQSRASAVAVGGYVFDTCYVSYTGTYGSSYGLTYLARPYSQYSIVVYKNSYLDKNINPAGWTIWSTGSPQTSDVTFGEYNNVGPSAWSTSTARASFATNLTEAQVSAYDLETFLGSTDWIDMEAYNFVPSVTFSASGVNGTIPVITPTPTPGSNVTYSRPSSGTVPPVGAVVVSMGGSISGSFANLTAALASLPADTTSQTIFMHPGSYFEQFKVNRPGAVTIVGYQSGNVGQTYTGNQVTITYSRGLSVVSPVAEGHTNAGKFNRL